MLSTRLPRAVLPAIVRARARSTAASTGQKKVVLVDGCRIPFQPSRGEYFDLMSYDLTRLAMHGLLTKTAVDPKAIDYVLWGKVIQEPKTSNIARDAAFAAGIPRGVPAHTVTQARRHVARGGSRAATRPDPSVLPCGRRAFRPTRRFARARRRSSLARPRWCASAHATMISIDEGHAYLRQGRHTEERKKSQRARERERERVGAWRHARASEGACKRVFRRGGARARACACAGRVRRNKAPADPGGE